MSKLTIRLHPDPVLRQKAKPVRQVNRAVRELLDDMAEAMREANGVGLAAPQVGVGKRVIIVDVGDGLIELINPELVRRSGSALGTEGCLSIPGKVGEVERAAEVTVVGLDRYGKRRWVEGSELLARALQHEIDHLDGVLFIDRAIRVIDANRAESEEAHATEGEAAQTTQSELAPADDRAAGDNASGVSAADDRFAAGGDQGT